MISIDSIKLATSRTTLTLAQSLHGVLLYYYACVYCFVEVNLVTFVGNRCQCVGYECVWVIEVRIYF